MQQTIGLVGLPASGKSTIASYFVDRGFVYYKLSDMIRSECEEQKLVVNRENLQNIGNHLRQEHGPSVLAQRVAQHASARGHEAIVIDGIRNPAELLFLREQHEAFILGVRAPKELRLRRYLERAAARPEDAGVASAFERADERERGKGETSDGLQVLACMQLADSVITNAGTLEELFFECEALIQSNLLRGE